MKRIIFLLLFVNLIFSCSPRECEDFIRETDTDDEFSGIISDAYFHVSDGGRGTPTLVLGNGSKHYIATYGLICYANQGDSIIKRKGTLKYLLKSEGTTTVFYPECKRKLILDSNKTAINPYREFRCGKEK
jgi:hypothetical protein